MELSLKNKKIVPERLSGFGFEYREKAYYYTSDLMDGQFELAISVTRDGTAQTKVTDKSTGEEYVLHLMSGAQGSFVGRVRDEYNEVTGRFVDVCCEHDVFKADCTKELIEYVRNTYGGELEFLWKKFSDNAVWRRKDNKKWYAVLLTVSRRKLGLNSDEIVEIVDFRMKPEEVAGRVDNKTYFPGWHMNKKNWATIILDGTVDIGEICRRIDESYMIAGK